MEGVVLVSHGSMAEGTANAVKMFFGDEIQQLGVVSLHENVSPDQFRENLKKEIEKQDSGDGVLVLADLLGGTPANQAALLASENVRIITGLSMTILLEVLGSRTSGSVDIAQLVETGKSGIVFLNELLNKPIRRGHR
ncbi:MAG: PTS sugar transporter subunit IIA [Erysipelotrichia bacterium]|nr:PTS sugar transporter subunit IIA [Erysipelotrichia bacterium]